MRNGLARTWLAPLASFPLLAIGCTTQGLYVVPTTQLAATRDAASQPAAIIQAQRPSDGQPVALRADALDLTSTKPAPTTTPQADAHRLVRARAYSPAVTAGATLTWVGTAVSLVGSGLFLAGRIRGDEGLFLAGSFTALAAEPVMWAGIAYWFAGTLRPAQEVAAPVVPIVSVSPR